MIKIYQAANFEFLNEYSAIEKVGKDRMRPKFNITLINVVMLFPGDFLPWQCK